MQYFTIFGLFRLRFWKLLAAAVRVQRGGGVWDRQVMRALLPAIWGHETFLAGRSACITSEYVLRGLSCFVQLARALGECWRVFCGMTPPSGLRKR